VFTMLNMLAITNLRQLKYYSSYFRLTANECALLCSCLKLVA
jgi:hypothetical protein